MKRTSFQDVNCSIARAVDMIGEWWTPLILRDLFVGITRFEDIRLDLAIATNVLTDRLDTLVDAGIVERTPYQERPVRNNYILTEKGRELYPVLLALIRWGDRWTAPEGGPPVLLFHNDCGRQTEPVIACDSCAGLLTPTNMTLRRGPSGHAGPGTNIIGTLLAP